MKKSKLEVIINWKKDSKDKKINNKSATINLSFKEHFFDLIRGFLLFISMHCGTTHSSPSSTLTSVICHPDTLLCLSYPFANGVSTIMTQSTFGLWRIDFRQNLIDAAFFSWVIKITAVIVFYRSFHFRTFCWHCLRPFRPVRNSTCQCISRPETLFFPIIFFCLSNYRDIFTPAPYDLQPSSGYRPGVYPASSSSLVFIYHSFLRPYFWLWTQRANGLVFWQAPNDPNHLPSCSISFLSFWLRYG